MKKILIVRFSSIGDIVLTTPVIRCLKEQLDCEIDYLTFSRHSDILKHNPYIDRLITIDRSIKEVVPALRKARYDLIIDLHRNIRTFSLKLQLLRPSRAFHKLNIRKLIMVWFKINMLPAVHIVDRYLHCVKRLGIKNDGKGLDYFVTDFDRAVALPEGFDKGYVAFVIGGNYTTKILPVSQVLRIISKIRQPVVLLGGVMDKARGEQIVADAAVPDVVYNGCGAFTLNESAAVIERASVVYTNDTGLMHIAAAMRRPIVSFWGNTIPEFGMTPYLPEGFQPQPLIIEVKGLRCRPCSKLGFNNCPKGHFDCMEKITYQPEE